ncbi:PTS beta-glucoside transporter subunit IIBCA [Anaerorhabdus sp.]|uniref:PTS beta-glucoside transporter subunit IIBCA n=1 Tax=Anaerorhabdus sp. TaxID=1872524 RepID=UPI002FC8D851
MEKIEKYQLISKEIAVLVGGEENIQGVAHCATRLRIVLNDTSLVDIKKLENVDLVKGVFITGDQLQIIFGAGLVNDVYAVFAKEVHRENMTLENLKTQSNQKQNPIQKAIKSLSDVFIEIIPAILAAALLMGLTGVLGKWDVVLNNPTLYSLNRLASLASTGIFAILPMAVCYSSTKRYGGRPILGLVVGAIMLDSSLANAYSIGTAGFNPEVLNLFGLQIQMIGFQGGVIIALMMGWVVANLDKFFIKRIPDVIKLLVAPMLTVFISTLLLFTVVGPVGRMLGDGISGSLIWMAENLGFLGYALFGGFQQIIVITGLHHIFGAVESQLITSTGRNFLNPLMSVALIGQAGAVLGYLALHWQNVKMRELCIPSFISTLFGISEPAIFGVNLRYRYPLIAGCIGGAVAGAYVYFVDLASLGFGTTAVPGIAIVDPSNNGYMNYIIAHIIGLVIAMVLTIIFGKLQKDTAANFKMVLPAKGKVESITKANDPTFSSKSLGDGLVITPTEELIVSPCDATVEFVFPTKHAIGLRLDNGVGLLIHCGINTVELNGSGFDVLVQKDQKVKANTPLLKMDIEAIRKQGYDTQILVVVTDITENMNVKIIESETTWLTFN